MPRYHVTLTDTEIQELKSIIQKGLPVGPCRPSQRSRYGWKLLITSPIVRSVTL